MISLKEIFKKNNCDKALKHNYDVIYEKYMSQHRNDPINILEVGIFKGNSIESWLEYFPNATIYGIDIFVRLRPEQIPVLKDPRVKWASCDSTKSSETSNLWSGVKFDYIIDDGLHTPKANKMTFDNLIDKLNEGGNFFIEDIFPLDIMDAKQMSLPWIKNNKEYNKEEYADFLKSIEKYKHDAFDQRHITEQPDSYMFVIKK